MANSSNSVQRDRLISIDAKNILDSAKPSILVASPRRGGYVPQKEGSPQNKTATAHLQTPIQDDVMENHTNGCPCKSLMEKESTFMSSVAYGADQPSCQIPPVESLYKKSNFSTRGVDSAMETASNENASMLAVAISTVMLMASEYPRIPDEYLEYTKNYLDCIKDQNQQNPPNIKGILKHINYLRDNGLVRPMGEESKEEIVEEADRGGVGIAEEGGQEGGEDAEQEAEGLQRSPRIKGMRKHQERLRSNVKPIPSSGYRANNKK